MCARACDFEVFMRMRGRLSGERERECESGRWMSEVWEMLENEKVRERERERERESREK